MVEYTLSYLRTLSLSLSTTQVSPLASLRTFTEIEPKVYAVRKSVWDYL